MKTNVGKPPLFLKKSDTKKASVWSDLTNNRIIRQHGGYAIPDDDLHAIKPYDSPLHTTELSPEEKKTTLSSLQREIDRLKHYEKQPIPPFNPTPQDRKESNKNDAEE